MFYLRYLRNELVRRRARTIVTLLGLGLGVALVIVIAGVSSGLDKAQKKTLNPLGRIGTDLTVTLQPQQDTRCWLPCTLSSSPHSTQIFSRHLQKLGPATT